MEKEEWLNTLRTHERYKWCSDDQWECCKMLFDLIGENHLINKIKPYGPGIEYNAYQSFSTYDFDLLSIAVFMAHDRCIRFEIRPSGPGLIRICLWKRQSRLGRVGVRHPALEEAISEYRKRHQVNQ